MQKQIDEVMGLVNEVQKNRVCAEMSPSNKEHFNYLADKAFVAISDKLRELLPAWQPIESSPVQMDDGSNGKENCIQQSIEMKIWTDGSSNPNPGIGGWGWHRSDGAQDFGGDVDTTNNRMEMTAVLEAMSKLPDGMKATIYSDSQYVINGLTTWRSGWKKKSWMKKGKPMLNRDLWVALEDQLLRIDASFIWVKGHAGNDGNELADRLATLGRNKAILS